MNEIDEHDCMDNAEAVSDWHIAGLGETLEKAYCCTVCSREFRDVYIYACTIDNKTDELLNENF